MIKDIRVGQKYKDKSGYTFEVTEVTLRGKYFGNYIFEFDFDSNINGFVSHCDTEYIEKETKELTVQEISDLLGYDVKVVK